RRNYYNSAHKCKWPYRACVVWPWHKPETRSISVVLIEIGVFRTFAFRYREQRTALGLIVRPVVEPGLCLEYPEADDVLPTMCFGCKFPAQLVEEPTVLDIRPAVYGID